MPAPGRPTGHAPVGHTPAAHFPVGGSSTANLINTASRRMSVQAYTVGLMRHFPSGVVDGPDRACVAWFYSGLPYEPVSTDREIYSFSALRNWFTLR